MVHRLLLTATILALAACAVPPPVAAETVGDRLAADEQRIQDGARLGQFTPGEYRELQGRHAAIERTRLDQLAEFGGRIPPGPYAQLEAREAALSRTIFDYRHNGATPTAH